LLELEEKDWKEYVLDSLNADKTYTDWFQHVTNRTAFTDCILSDCFSD